MAPSLFFVASIVALAFVVFMSAMWIFHKPGANEDLDESLRIWRTELGPRAFFFTHLSFPLLFSSYVLFFSLFESARAPFLVARIGILVGGGFYLRSLHRRHRAAWTGKVRSKTLSTIAASYRFQFFWAGFDVFILPGVLGMTGTRAG